MESYWTAKGKQNQLAHVTGSWVEKLEESYRKANGTLKESQRAAKGTLEKH